MLVVVAFAKGRNFGRESTVVPRRKVKPMNTMSRSAVLTCCLLAATMLAPVQAQTISSRTFTDAFSARVSFEDDGYDPNPANDDWAGQGAGIFDPQDSNNSCLALIFANAGASILLLFYLNGRIVTEGPFRIFGGLFDSGHAWRDATGQGNIEDPTDCAGLANPSSAPGSVGNQFGFTTTTHRTGGFFVNSPIPSNVILPASATLTYGICPIAAVPVLTVPNYVDCPGAAEDLLFTGSGVLDNHWDADFYAADMDFYGIEGPMQGNGISESGVISSCAGAEVFDGVSAFVAVADSDYFFVVSYEDYWAAAAGDAAAQQRVIDTKMLSIDVTQHSAINYNGAGNLGDVCAAVTAPPPESWVFVCAETGVRLPIVGIIAATQYPCPSIPCPPPIPPAWAIVTRVIGDIGASVRGELVCTGGSVFAPPCTVAVGDLGHRVCTAQVVGPPGQVLACRRDVAVPLTGVVSYKVQCTPDP